MSDMLEAAAFEFSRKLAMAIEERLLMAAGTGMDVAVIRTMEGHAVELRFELVRPGGPYPPGCTTVYRTSLLQTGRA